MNVLETSHVAKARISKLISESFSINLRPIPRLTLVEWADTFRYLPDNSAEPGLWKTDRMPPAREIMLEISNAKVQEITVMCCIQAMKTELMINTALYYIHQEPSPLMYVAPKKEIAEAWSKERFMKSAKATPVTRDIFADNRRGEGNTILQKQYPGGQLSIVSARNPDDLAMRACRVLLFDEVDKYPMNVGAGDGGSGGEGDPIAVAWGRATTYGKRAKKITACSPTVENRSRIESEYKAGSQGIFLQRCPHCDHAFEVDWFIDVVIPVDESTGDFKHDKAHIKCRECNKPWNEGQRLRSIRNGHWVHKRPEVWWHRSYCMSSMASSFTPIPTLALEYIKATGNPQLMKAFYNTRLAKTWREVGEQPSWERLYERREDYEIGVVPDGALMITMAIDVQQKGIYYEFMGWGREKERWSIETGYIAGDIGTEEMKVAIHKLMRREFPNSVGVMMPVEKGCIDSNYKTQRVYNIVRSFNSDRFVAIRGEDSETLKTIIGVPSLVDITQDGKRITRGLNVYPVGSSVCKEEFYGLLNLQRPTDEELEAGRRYPDGYCHFPSYQDEYFKQITAEQLELSEDKRGFTVSRWVKTRKDNHFLDTQSYNRAAAAMLQIDRYDEDDWIARERLYGLLAGVTVDTTSTANDTTEQVSQTPVKQHKLRKKGWLKRG